MFLKLMLSEESHSSAMTTYLKSDHKVYTVICTGSGLFQIRGLVE